MPLPPVPLPVAPLQSKDQGRIRAERLVAEAALLARTSGLAPMLREINRGRGPFAIRGDADLRVVVYDLKGKVLAYAGDVRHVGMDHAKAVAGLLVFTDAHLRGWYAPPQEEGVEAPKVCFERLEHALITVALRAH